MLLFKSLGIQNNNNLTGQPTEIKIKGLHIYLFKFEWYLFFSKH